MEIGEETRHCQNETTYERCATEEYIKALISTCNCLPLSILDDKNVRINELLQGPALFEKKIHSFHFSKTQYKF